MRDGEYLLNIECCVTVFLNFMVFGGRLHQQRIFIHNLGLFAVVLMKMVCCFLFLFISWAGCLGKSTSFCRFFCATSFLAGVRTRRGRKELMRLVPVFGRILHFAPYFLLFFHCLSPPYILLRASTSLNLWSYPLSGRRSVARTELPNPNVFTIYIYVYIVSLSPFRVVLSIFFSQVPCSPPLPGILHPSGCGGCNRPAGGTLLEFVYFVFPLRNNLQVAVALPLSNAEEGDLTTRTSKSLH